MSWDMAQLAQRAKRAAIAAGDMIWPSRSLVSGARDIGSGVLLPDEWAALSFLAGPVCDVCGLPQEVELGDASVCAACIARPPAWSAARAAIVYDEASRRIVLDLKRSGRRDGLVTLSQWMAQAGEPLLVRADMMVPVPLHYRRLVARGFNQSGWLAYAVSRRSGVPVRVDILRRRKATPSQAGKSRAARRRNMSGAFAVRRGKAAAIDGKCVLLVDDVLTTGATLRSCARVLLQAGAARVDVLTLARVVRPTDISI